MRIGRCNEVSLTCYVQIRHSLSPVSFVYAGDCFEFSR
jgi:hypothetical protein